MGHIASARGQIKAVDNVIPDAAQTPTAHTHFKALADALEARSVLRLSNISMASTAPESLNPLQDGMFVVTTSAPFEIYYRAGGAWKKVWPTILSGTTAPTPAQGSDGDIYVLYA